MISPPAEYETLLNLSSCMVQDDFTKAAEVLREYATAFKSDELDKVKSTLSEMRSLLSQNLHPETALQRMNELLNDGHRENQ